MKAFMNEDFLLTNKTASNLYHKFADEMPVIDYHCHLNPADIAADRKFKNITEAWLEGDHYKWRAMRANGIDEKYCTGNASAKEKFIKWAETVPATLRNPLYHWTHLELKRYFGIEDLLSADTASKIYDEITELLQKDEYSVRNLLRRMNVEVLCTTDDPIDSLEHHQMIREDGFEIKVLPTWRADKVLAIEDNHAFNIYIDKLETVAIHPIKSFMDLLEALAVRHDFFAEMGCKLSDHGLETFYYTDYHHEEIEIIFLKLRQGVVLTSEEALKYKSAMLVELAVMDHEKDWTQQFHIGAIRNNNSRMYDELGPDTGFDSINDLQVAQGMSKLFDRLDSLDQLAKTIVYNLNPNANEVMMTMAYNFSDGKIPGKMQFGSGWWFMDQKSGMENQMNTLSQLGLISHFVGMLTDSRSFLSYPRHEYFRRILCNLFGTDIENGELPADMDLIGEVIRNICYGNAKKYFGF